MVHNLIARPIKHLAICYISRCEEIRKAAFGQHISSTQFHPLLITCTKYLEPPVQKFQGFQHLKMLERIGNDLRMPQYSLACYGELRSAWISVLVIGGDLL